MKKIDARKLTTEQQQLLRNQAMKLRKQGKKYKEISDITGVNPTTICTWWKSYERDGEKDLKIKKRGRELGANRNLTPDQEREIKRTIREKAPDQLKFPFALWNRRAIQDLIRHLYSIEMPIRTVGEYLKRWGYTPQKPLKKAYKQNPKAVQKWLDEEYPAIQKKAKLEKAEIHWGDETGLCNDSYHGRSYAPKGETPEIRVHPRCHRVNLISSITNQGKVRFMVYNERMNAQTLIKFLKRLIKDSKRKILLILDNLKVHHSFLVKDWLSENKDQIEVFFLPSYSPELNPDEYLNCDLKTGVHSGPPAKNKEELKRKAISHLRKLQKMPKRVEKYFKHRKIAYAGI